MSSRVRGVSSSLLDSFTGLGGFMRTAFFGAAFVAAFGVLGSCTSFLGRPRFLGSGRIGLLSVATGGSSTISGGASTFSEISGSSTGVVSGSGTSTGSRLTDIFW